jgi:hypothetical protein
VSLRLPPRQFTRLSRRLFQLALAATAISLASLPLAALNLPALAGTSPRSEWWLSKLHVTQAWRTGGGAGVTIAVLADGVNASQPDLTGRVTSGPDFTRSNRTSRGAYYGVIGTGLASLIAGHGHGQKSASGAYSAGIYGVADKASILAVRVTLSPGDPLWSNTSITSRLTTAIVDGIRYAVQHKASVILLPADPGLPGISGWGGVTSASGGSPAERSAVEYAISHNVVLVAPAGDNAQAGDAMNYPAAYAGVIAVGAFGQNFAKAPYSCRRSYVTLTAAGNGVTAAAPTGYRTMNSTWAAGAIAAGIAALIRGQFPDLSAAQVTTAMTQGTVYQPANGMQNGSGHGTVDAEKAILAAATMSPPHAKSAFAGALPQRRPVMPHVQSQAAIIEGGLLRDGALSGALLAVLLIPIAWYGYVIRKRDRQAALIAAEWERDVRPRADQGMLADPLLEFFGPQHASPAGSYPPRRALASSKFQPRPALEGRSTLTSAFAQRPMLAAPPTPGWAGGRGQQSAGASTGQAHPGAREPEGQPDAVASPDTVFRPSGQLPPTLRRAPVSGSPPWEPAPRPTSELPWTAVQGTQADSGLSFGRPTNSAGSNPVAAYRQGPPEAAWEASAASASSAPQPIFDPGPSPEQTQSGAGIREPFQQTTDSGGRPIYVWNPGSAADAPQTDTET